MTAYLSKDFEPSEPAQEIWYPLRCLGPEIDVSVSLHPAEAQALRTRREQPPPSIPANGLIDTGASMTVLDDRLFTGLRPSVVGVIPLKPFQEQPPIMASVVHIRLEFPGSRLPPWDHPVAVAPLSTKTGGTLVLLGRDFLQNYIFEYDGRNGRIALR